MVTVYIDRVFVLNSLVDYLLLLTTSRLAGIPLRRVRLALCALAGGVYASAVFLPSCAVLAQPALMLPFGSVMALTAFWRQPKKLRLTALFFLLSGGLAGVLLAMGLMAGSPGMFLGRIYRAEISWPVLLGATGIFYGLLRLLFARSVRHVGGEIMEITVNIGRKQRKVLALHDTGNTLCDPVSGEPVLVLEQEVLYDLWPPEISGIVRQTMPPEEKMVRLHSRKLGSAFSLLPFRSVGVPAGLLLAFRSDRITVGKVVHRRTLLALSEGPISDGGAYQALWGGERRGRYEETAASDPLAVPALEETV